MIGLRGLCHTWGFLCVKVSQRGDVDANFGFTYNELNIFNQIQWMPLACEGVKPWEALERPFSCQNERHLIHFQVKHCHLQTKKKKNTMNIMEERK